MDITISIEDFVSACELEAFTISVLAIGAIMQLTVLSAERCLMIWRPFLEKNILLSQKCAVIALVYLISIAMSVPPLFGWSRFNKANEQFFCTSAVSSSFFRWSAYWSLHFQLRLYSSRCQLKIIFNLPSSYGIFHADYYNSNKLCGHFYYCSSQRSVCLAQQPQQWVWKKFQPGNCGTLSVEKLTCFFALLESVSQNHLKFREFGDRSLENYR